MSAAPPIPDLQSVAIADVRGRDHISAFSQGLAVLAGSVPRLANSLGSLAL